MGKEVGHKLKIAGWLAVGAVAGALTTVQFQAVARGTLAPLPLEELQQLAEESGLAPQRQVGPQPAVGALFH